MTPPGMDASSCWSTLVAGHQMPREWLPELQQAELAVAAADAVVFVVDATVGTQDIDEAVVKVLRRVGNP